MRFKGRELMSVQVEAIDASDAPDFVDAFVSFTTYVDDDAELTDAELDELNEDRQLVYDAVMKQVY